MRKDKTKRVQKNPFYAEIQASLRRFFGKGTIKFGLNPYICRK